MRIALSDKERLTIDEILLRTSVSFDFGLVDFRATVVDTEVTLSKIIDNGLVPAKPTAFGRETLKG